MKRYIILCAGNSDRWANNLSTPKHFIRIDGVPLLNRTVNLIRMYDENAEIFIVANDDSYKIDGTTLYKPTLNEQNFDVDKFLSSQELWLNDGYNVLLFGDIFFTNAAMYRICKCVDNLMFFGRIGENIITKHPYGELFGVSFDKKGGTIFNEHCNKVAEKFRNNEIEGAGGWLVYGSLVGLAFPVQEQRECFTNIYDFTEDFDTPTDYDNFMEQQKIVFNGYIEADHSNGAYLVPWVLKHIKRREVKTILELGSGNGMDAVRLFNYYPFSKVYTFEANPGTYPIIEKNLINYPEITFVPKAVSDKNETIKFYPVTDGRHLASSMFLAKDTYPEKFKQSEIEVEAIRLDEYIKANNIPPIDMLCIDIQGAALKALKGMGEYLKDVTYIISEVETKPIYEGQNCLPEIEEYLKQFGFEYVENSTTNEYYGDYLFIRRSE